MLEKLSIRIHDIKDLERMISVLHETIIINGTFREEIQWLTTVDDACNFGLLHAYHEHILRLLTKSEELQTIGHHTTLLKILLDWLKQNENLICQLLDERSLTFKDITDKLESRGILTMLN